MVSEVDFFKKVKTRGINLTEQQKQAVVHNQGPLLLLVVPGAGKTTVLTVRLAYLILVENVDPFSEEYVGGLLDILNLIAQNERTIVDFANRLTYLEELMTSSYKRKHSNAVTFTTILMNK